MPLQIADQRAVSLPLAPCPVVHADDAEFAGRCHGRVSNAPQECVLAELQKGPSGKRLGGAAAESKAQMTDQPLQAWRAPRM
ncbi:hypothetical protein SAMN05444959_103333 [Paracoccus seriniphilus]|uniref:Uncharacterized protein n=1 Tax=Paracoccus seriniphilus TaxID=184748 RepID=A0A239PRQ7_9RHOB|nr:hypothetical protein SAMN05444959_103333 [Paracoccus seriniphilus]